MCLTADVMVVFGTRPEIVKMAPIIREMQRNSFPFILVHCGQHYDYNMSQQFIEELGLPEPHYGFKIKTVLPGVQTGRIMAAVEKAVREVKPKLVLVEGDTNGVLASALAAVKLNVSVGHVEAGLRSFDLRMPEEHNRRLVDHISAYLFAPTENAEANLRRENVWGKIYVTGNTVIDAVVQHMPLAESKSKIMETVRFEEFALATAHRAENVDNPVVLKNFVEAFMESPIPIVYPVHPRTVRRLKQFGLWKSLFTSKNVQLVSSLGYFDFLVLMKNCKMILTDSGGIQEEATAPLIRKRVLVLRLSTERPEAVEAGFAKVVGVDKKEILNAIRQAMETEAIFPSFSPFGEGDAAQKIVKILCEEGFL